MLCLPTRGTAVVVVVGKVAATRAWASVGCGDAATGRREGGLPRELEPPPGRCQASVAVVRGLRDSGLGRKRCRSGVGGGTGGPGGGGQLRKV